MSGTIDFFKAIGSIVSINNVSELGDWEYYYDKDNLDFSLSINTRLTPEDYDTLGSRSGFWENQKTFIHIAETHYFNETIKDDVFGYMFAWGNASTFEAVSMPQNLATEKTFKQFLRMPTQKLISNIKKLIVFSGRTGHDVFRGKTNHILFTKPSDHPPVKKDVPRERMRKELSEAYEDIRSERATSSKLAAFSWFVGSFFIMFYLPFSALPPEFRFWFSLIFSLATGYFLQLVGYSELLDKLTRARA